jgi:hypothetical protein
LIRLEDGDQLTGLERIDGLVPGEDGADPADGGADPGEGAPDDEPPAAAEP